MGGLLTQVYDLFAADVTGKPFDWVDSASRELQTLNNCSLEPAAQNMLAAKNFDEMA